MNKDSLPRQFALDLSQAPKASLENYLPGKDRALHSTLQNLINNWKTKDSAGESVNPLNQRWIYWWGAAGSGRTHLLAALGNAAEALELEYFSLNPLEAHSWVQLEERITSLSMSNLISIITVDDVERLNESLVASLFRILNEITTSKAIHIFMVGNAPPNSLLLRDDLRTRLGWGLIFQTHLLGDDEKMQAIEQAAQARGLVLSPDVLPWLLNRFYRDMPNLMALIDALDAYSLETKRAVTLPLVRELLQSK
jgi:DnaA family protein